MRTYILITFWQSFKDYEFTHSTKFQKIPEYTKENDIEVIEGDYPEEEERQQWSNPIEFLLSCVAMSVGLGSKI